MSEQLLNGLLTAAVSLLQAVFWTDNLVRSLRLHGQYRDARSFRSLLIATILALASWTYVGGAVAIYLFPPLLDAVRSAAMVVRGAFLVLGLFTFVSWRPQLAALLERWVRRVR